MTVSDYDNTNNVLQGTTPGEMLSAARKMQGKTEKSVASALKISVCRLKAIEADDFSDFPSETYIRGHLKNYGRLLGLDEALLNQTFEFIKTQWQENSVNLERSLSIDNSHKQWWFVYLVLVVTVLLWVLSYWLLGGQSGVPASYQSDPNANSDVNANANRGRNIKSPTSKTSAVADSSLGLVENNSPEFSENRPDFGEGAAQFAENGIDNMELKLSHSENTDQSIIVSKITAAELVKSVIPASQIKRQEDDVETEAGMLATGDSLSFRFGNPCWIKVTDANGDVIFSGLQQAGTDLSLYGEAPFNIVVGNVDGTSLMYNGEPVALNPESGSKLARLQVGG